MYELERNKHTNTKSGEQKTSITTSCACVWSLSGVKHKAWVATRSVSFNLVAPCVRRAQPTVESVDGKWSYLKIHRRSLKDLKKFHLNNKNYIIYLIYYKKGNNQTIHLFGIIYQNILFTNWTIRNENKIIKKFQKNNKWRLCTIYPEGFAVEQEYTSNTYAIEATVKCVHVLGSITVYPYKVYGIAIVCMHSVRLCAINKIIWTKNTGQALSRHKHWELCATVKPFVNTLKYIICRKIVITYSDEIFTNNFIHSSFLLLDFCSPFPSLNRQLNYSFIAEQ